MASADDDSSPVNFLVKNDTGGGREVKRGSLLRPVNNNNDGHPTCNFCEECRIPMCKTRSVEPDMHAGESLILPSERRLMVEHRAEAVGNRREETLPRLLTSNQRVEERRGDIVERAEVLREDVRLATGDEAPFVQTPAAGDDQLEEVSEAPEKHCKPLGERRQAFTLQVVDVRETERSVSAGLLQTETTARVCTSASRREEYTRNLVGKPSRSCDSRRQSPHDRDLGTPDVMSRRGQTQAMVERSCVPCLQQPSRGRQENEHGQLTYSAGSNYLFSYDNANVSLEGETDNHRAADSFEQVRIHDAILANAEEAGFTKLTQFQKQALLTITSGRDLVVHSNVGSGKVTAVLLAIMTDMLDSGLERDTSGEVQFPRCLIISPSREITFELGDKARQLSQGSKIRTAVMYGGLTLRHSLGQLAEGADILVTTFGRLQDAMSCKKLDLSETRHLVLYKADLLVNMGLMQDVKAFVKEHTVRMRSAESGQQTIIISHEFSREMQQFARDMLTDYLVLTCHQMDDMSQEQCQEL